MEDLSCKRGKIMITIIGLAIVNFIVICLILWGIGTKLDFLGQMFFFGNGKVLMIVAAVLSIYFAIKGF